MCKRNRRSIGTFLEKNIRNVIRPEIMTFINSAALNKIRRVAGTSFSADKEMRFQASCFKVTVDSVDRRSSTGKLFQISGPETATFLRPTAVAFRCTSSLPFGSQRVNDMMFCQFWWSIDKTKIFLQH